MTASPPPARTPATPGHDVFEVSYPAIFAAADAASLAGQRTYRWLIRFELGLLLAGAAAGTFAALQPSMSGVLPTLAALSFLAAVLLKIVNRERRYDQQWFDGRAVAETVKSSTWRYMLRVPPFDNDATANETFLAQVRAAFLARPRLHAALASTPMGQPQITREMRALRHLPVDERRQTYQLRRLTDQARWYQQKSRANRRQADVWFWLTLVAEVAGLGIATSSLIVPAVDDWHVLSLVAAVATAATAWSQLNRHDELSKSYGLAFEELLLIDGMADLADTEEALARVVDQAESAISREHTMWMAKLAQEAALGASPGRT